MNAHELLIEPSAYIAPASALEGLTAEQAQHRPVGAPHSIAEIVAHLAFWQDWFVGRAEGSGVPIPAPAAVGWPVVAPGGWEDIVTGFRDGLGRAAGLGQSDGSRLVTPPLEFPPEARYTVADVMTHIAVHNAHHLGQVVLLRQLQGLWPPPAGSWTW